MRVQIFPSTSHECISTKNNGKPFLFGYIAPLSKDPYREILPKGTFAYFVGYNFLYGNDKHLYGAIEHFRVRQHYIVFAKAIAPNGARAPLGVITPGV